MDVKMKNKKSHSHFDLAINFFRPPRLKHSNSRLYLANNLLKIPKSKRSQITIFIILGLIVIVLIALLFLLIKPPEIKVIDENNPQAFIESCTRESVEQALDILSKQGGDIEPKGYISYNG